MRILAGATTFVRRVVDLLLLGLIVVVLVAVALGRGAPLVGRESIVIGGGSMEPAIPLGAAIVVGPVDPASLAVGDVVSLNVGESHTTFTHRVVAVVDRADGRWIRTKGDANAEPDPTLVPARDVIGRVEIALPYFGYLLTLLSLPVGVIFVLGLAATLLAIAWLLESLEPDKVVVTRISSEGAGADLAASCGEPISARPSRIALPRTGLTAAFSASSGPSIPSIPSSVARPSVRDQIARGRERRERSARWQLGRGERIGRD